MEKETLGVQGSPGKKRGFFGTIKNLSITLGLVFAGIVGDGVMSKVNAQIAQEPDKMFTQLKIGPELAKQLSTTNFRIVFGLQSRPVGSGQGSIIELGPEYGSKEGLYIITAAHVLDPTKTGKPKIGDVIKMAINRNDAEYPIPTTEVQGEITYAGDQRYADGDALIVRVDSKLAQSIKSNYIFTERISSFPKDIGDTSLVGTTPVVIGSVPYGSYYNTDIKDASSDADANLGYYYNPIIRSDLFRPDRNGVETPEKKITIKNLTTNANMTSGMSGSMVAVLFSDGTIRLLGITDESNLGIGVFSQTGRNNITLITQKLLTVQFKLSIPTATEPTTVYPQENKSNAYPNPVNRGGIVNFKIEMELPGVYEAKIYNVLGKEVGSAMPQGGGIFSFDTHRLPSGTYIAHIRMPKGWRSIRFVIQ